MIKDLITKRLEMEKELDLKTNITHTQKVEESILRFCLYSDLKNLQERFEPKFETMQDNMELFKKEHEVMNSLILTFDSAISTKANKTDVF
jgi:hypothetical protein